MLDPVEDIFLYGLMLLIIVLVLGFLFHFTA